MSAIKWWVAALLGFSLLKDPVSTKQPAISAETAVKLRIQETIRFSPWDLVTALSWSPDGAVLAVAAGDDVVIYQAAAWEKQAVIHVGALTHGLEFSSDGKWLAAGSRDGMLRIWETYAAARSPEKPPMHIALAHRKGVNSLRFSLDGSMLATGGNDAIARFWDPFSGKQTGMTIGGSFAVPSIEFSPQGDFLAIINGNVVRLRQAGSERILGTFQADGPLYRVRVSPDGSKVLATGSDNLIRIWEADQAYRTGLTVYPEPVILEGHHGTPGSYRALVWDAAFSPDGLWLASAGGDGMFNLWDPISKTLLDSQFAHQRGATCIAFHPDGTRIATGGLDGNLKIWEFLP